MGEHLQGLQDLNIELINRYGIRPKKSLGQHFVIDPNTIGRILRVGKVAKDDYIIEVGAGCGALTLGLAERAKKVIAIETDSKLLPILEEVLSPHSVDIICDDVLNLDLAKLLDNKTQYKMVANLPYNIAARLIINVLENYFQIFDLTVMVQKEIAERFLAKPGSSNFGLVSLKAQFYCDITSGGKVSSSVFYPKPNVDSELLCLVRRPDLNLRLNPDLETNPKPILDPQPIFKLARQAFSMRRKMLRKSLAGEVAPEKFASAGVSPSARPQELSFEDWAKLL